VRSESSQDLFFPCDVSDTGPVVDDDGNVCHVQKGTRPSQ
jgi:hypothetical protein